MICFPHVSFPDFFFFNCKLLSQSPKSRQGKPPGAWSWPWLPTPPPSSTPATALLPPWASPSSSVAPVLRDPPAPRALGRLPLLGLAPRWPCPSPRQQRPSQVVKETGVGASRSPANREPTGSPSPHPSACLFIVLSEVGVNLRGQKFIDLLENRG